MTLNARHLGGKLNRVPKTSINAVRASLRPLRKVRSRQGRMARVTITPHRVVGDTTSNVLIDGEGVLPLLSRGAGLSVRVVLGGRGDLLIRLLAVAISRLSTIIVVQVITYEGRSATIGVVYSNGVHREEYNNGVRGVHIYSQDYRAKGGQVLGRMTKTSNILSCRSFNELFGLFLLLRLAVVPTWGSTSFMNVFYYWICIDFTARTIYARMFSRLCYLLVCSFGLWAAGWACVFGLCGVLLVVVLICVLLL